MSQPIFTCNSTTIERFLQNSLSLEDQLAFETHLDECDRCC